MIKTVRLSAIKLIAHQYDTYLISPIVAGKFPLLTAEDAAEQPGEEQEKAGKPPLGPAQPLAHHDSDGVGLLVKKFRGLAKFDLPPLRDGGQAELRVLRQAGIVPAV